MPFDEELLARIHSGSDYLLRVQGVYWVDPPHQDMLVAICFEYDQWPIVAWAAEDDTIHIEESSVYRRPTGVVLRDLSSIPPWKDAVGKPLLWSWSMTNQQGYRDGLQLHFANTADEMGVEIQLLVVASEISVRIISAIES